MSEVLVLDGGLSNALEDRGNDLSGELWTARLLAEDPDEIVAVHAAYFAAGAQVATAASYQASVPGLVAAGLDRAAAERLVTRSVELARRARDEACVADGPSGSSGDLLVAASVGPYGAVLADGSEYTGRYGLSDAALRDFHAPRLELLAAAGPDLLAVETIPDQQEAEVLVPLLDELGLPAWLSFAVADGRTRAGQPLADAFAVAVGSPAVVAVGVNCSDAGEVPAALRTAYDVTGKPGVAYPNRGESWDSDARSWVGPGSWDIGGIGGVDGWLDAGARLVGGCCRVGPSDIAPLASYVRRRFH
ncbi:homocysteine S-methyltransferase [Nocardioides sp. HDW12B]|nr:homocysteine S-methyltransferase [Nocardioides sp. HDW12B]